MGMQPMTGMDDVERQTPNGDTGILDKKIKLNAAGDCRILCIIMIAAAVFTACVILPLEYLLSDTHYYVAIDSASDLSPTEGLSFNLTLGVASRSYGTKACIEPGMLYLEVSYHGVELAASESEVGRLCIGPRKSAEQHQPVVARAVAVPVGYMLDRFTADMKQGSAVFDITLYPPPGPYGRRGRRGVLVQGQPGGRCYRVVR
jgi:hypothetical protein